MIFGKTGLVVLLAFALGAGLTFLVEHLYWNNELSTQFREKDRLFAELKQSAEALRNSNQELSALNVRMSTTIRDAKDIVATLGEHADGSIERMKRILSSLKRLKEVLSANM